MKKIVFIVAIACVLAAVAFFYFTSPDEASDVVIITTRDAPTPPTDKASPPSRPTPLPTQKSKQDNSSLKSEREKRIETELAQSFEELPRLEDLQNLDEHAVHHTPATLKAGGMQVGSIIQKAQDLPERRRPTLNFLLKCSEGEELPDPVRAVCWNSLLTHVAKWKLFFPITSAQVPPRIKSLASKLR